MNWQRKNHPVGFSYEFIQFVLTLYLHSVHLSIVDQSYLSLTLLRSKRFSEFNHHHHHRLVSSAHIRLFRLHSTRYSSLLHPSRSFNFPFSTIELRPLRHGHPYAFRKCAFQYFEGRTISNRSDCRKSGTGRHRKDQQRGGFAVDITCVLPVLILADITHWPCCSRPRCQERPIEEPK